MTKLEHALKLIEHGYSIHLDHGITAEGDCTCGRKECPAAGKHPMFTDWMNKSTKDPEKVKQWFEEYPDANIGIPTGPKHDTLSFDIDGEEGLASLFAIEMEYGPLPKTHAFSTGKGLRLFFHWPEGLESRNKIRLRPGIDMQGELGQTVGPGSLHKSGRIYQWKDGHACWETDKMITPEHIVEMINESKPKDGGEPGTFTHEPHDAPEPPYSDPKYWMKKAAEKAAPGNRNDTALWLAGQLLDNIYQFDKGRDVELEGIMDEFADAVDERGNPFTASEARNVYASAKNYRAINGFRPPVETHGKLVITRERKTYALTDLGNAQRFVDQWGNDYRYLGCKGEWLQFDNHIWREAAGSDPIFERLTDTVKSIESEVWGKISQSNERITSMEKLVKRMLLLPAEDLNRDPFLFGVGNGIVDLKTGKLIEGKRDHFITQAAPFDFDENARAPGWERFLEEIIPDREVREFLQKWTGYTLTGDITEQCLSFFFGGGKNGKSTYMTTIYKMMGSYSESLISNTLMEKKFDDIPNDLAKIKDARFVTVSEISQGKKLDEAKIKSITGGEQITARFLRQEYFTYYPQFKIWMYGNHKPRIDGKDDGIWRRIRLVPFTVQIPDKDVDRNLPAKLEAELPGIFNWALEGTLKWQKEGRLVVPKAVIKAGEDYKREEDVLSGFIEDCCVIENGATARKADMWTAYLNWSNLAGERIFETDRGFNRNLKETPGIESVKGHANVALWRNIRLTDEWLERVH